MNSVLATGLRFAFALVAGFCGIFAGGIAGAVVGRFVTGEKGIHGLDPPAMFCAAAGVIAGLLAGLRIGNLVAAKVIHSSAKDSDSEATPKDHGTAHED